ANSMLACSLVRRNVAILELDHLKVIERAIDLVGRSEDEGGKASCAAHGLDHVECPTRIDFKVIDRLIKAGRHCRLRSKVKHRGCVGKGGLDHWKVADIGKKGVDPVAELVLQPCKVLVNARP